MLQAGGIYSYHFALKCQFFLVYALRGIKWIFCSFFYDIHTVQIIKNPKRLNHQTRTWPYANRLAAYKIV